MNRSVFVLIFSFLYSACFAQDMGIHFGHQMFSSFQSTINNHGISIGLDIPRSGFVTPYGQVSLFLPYNSNPATDSIYLGEAVPKNNQGFSKLVFADYRVTHVSLELGSIYYIGGAYDYGLSFMMHNSFRIAIFSTRYIPRNFDPETYEFIQPPAPSPPIGARSAGLVLYTNLGLGLKYSFDWGSLYGMAGIDVMLLPYQPPISIQSFLAYHTRIGIRRDLNFSGNAERKEQRAANRRERNSW